jgi:hypothetical protein
MALYVPFQAQMIRAAEGHIRFFHCFLFWSRSKMGLGVV